MTNVEILRAFLVYSMENSGSLQTIEACMESWNKMGRRAEKQFGCECKGIFKCDRCKMYAYMKKSSLIFK